MVLMSLKMFTSSPIHPHTPPLPHVPSASYSGLAAKQRPSEATAHMPKFSYTVEVILKKENESFGIHLAGGSDYPKRPHVYVSYPASTEGALLTPGP